MIWELLLLHCSLITCFILYWNIILLRKTLDWELIYCFTHRILLELSLIVSLFKSVFADFTIANIRARLLYCVPQKMYFSTHIGPPFSTALINVQTIIPLNEPIIQSSSINALGLFRAYHLIHRTMQATISQGNKSNCNHFSPCSVMPWELQLPSLAHFAFETLTDLSLWMNGLAAKWMNE